MNADFVCYYLETLCESHSSKLHLNEECSVHASLVFFHNPDMLHEV